LADTSGGAFTITLPATPSAGNYIEINDPKKTWATNNLTVARNGSNIDSLAEDLVCNISAAIGLTYINSTIGWEVDFINEVGGVQKIHQNIQSSSYTLVASDLGKHIYTNAGVTVPQSVFNAGDVVSIVNSSASTITITQGTSVTMYLSGVGSTGNRTLALRGAATLLCVATNTFVIMGAGLG
jgi:hypothetical protein